MRSIRRLDALDRYEGRIVVERQLGDVQRGGMIEQGRQIQPAVQPAPAVEVRASAGEDAQLDWRSAVRGLRAVRNAVAARTDLAQQPIASDHHGWDSLTRKRLF